MDVASFTRSHNEATVYEHYTSKQIKEIKEAIMLVIQAAQKHISYELNLSDYLENEYSTATIL